MSSAFDPPRIIPPDGAPVASGAPAITGLPVTISAPAGPFVPTRPDNPLLVFRIAKAAEILAGRARLSGASLTANLKDQATVGGGQAQVDLGGPRPVTRVNFAKADGAQPSQLLIQLGGAWFLPQSAGGVNFSNYPPNTTFPELVTTKLLLSNAAGVSDVESTTFPANVTLRLTDGGVPFFFQRGDLRGAVQVPDFGQQLAQAVRGAEPIDGFCRIELVAHSDAPGTIIASQAQISYRMALNSLAGRSADQRTMLVPPGAAVSFAMPVPAGLKMPAGRPPVAAVSLALLALGFGPTFAPPVFRHGAIVSSQFRVAQPLSCPAGLTASTVYLALAKRTPQAKLTVELRADDGDAPLGAVIGSATLDLAAPASGDGVWRPVVFGRPVALAAQSRIWIVLQVDQGEVEWLGDDLPPGGGPSAVTAARYSTDRGTTWQDHPLSASFVFQQQLPDPAAPLSLTISAGTAGTQALTYDPAAFPLALDGDTPLVRGLNQALSRIVGSALPPQVALSVKTSSALPVQLTLTRLDVTYAQDT